MADQATGKGTGAATVNAPTSAGSTVEQRLAFLEAQNASLSAQNAALKAAKPQQAFTLKVGAKGGLSVYGLGRFPVTLYRSQWERLLGSADKITAFIAAHSGELAVRE